MRTLVFTIADPAPGDLIVINSCSRRGGKDSVKHKILGERAKPVYDKNGNMTGSESVPPETSLEIIKDLVSQIQADWLPECIEAKVKQDTAALVLNCTDLCDSDFSVEVQNSDDENGVGTTIVSMNEF